jgi:hypothetical protein
MSKTDFIKPDQPDTKINDNNGSSNKNEYNYKNYLLIGIGIKISCQKWLQKDLVNKESDASL